jgi:hypothetical protein
MALAVSAGDCSAGRAGVVAACLDLLPAVEGVVVWAWAERQAAININVAAGTDLMTLLKSIEAGSIKHICWVDTNGRWVHHVPAGAKGKSARC